MKYIIEADERSELVQVISVMPNGTVYTNERSIDELEELNSDYINEHYGSLQDDAYQRGLNDAWEAVRKIVLNTDEGGASLQDMYAIFGNNASMPHICRSYSASEVIEKFKAYEVKQKADDEIKVGDEVDCSGDSFIVTRIFHAITGKVECDGVDMDGCTYHDVLISGLTKTGRHVDIDKILGELRE